ncbi:MAG: pyruvate synthase, partial [Candidatus Tectomicrobia bacterium]|nr:pyruvate synthase [Candidatus Tectomicrobia bacterium]
GCFTLLATFPYTPFKSSWLYTSMASAAAGAQGIRDALDVLMARGKMAPTDDVQVVVVAGDGSTYDMGLAATSGALFRGLDLLFIAHAPCPTGWLYDPERTAEYARLAVETGIFALKEAVDGAVTHTYKPRRRRPVEDYLRGQGRYRHLFEPEPDTTALGHIQRQLDEYWAAVS